MANSRTVIVKPYSYYHAIVMHWKARGIKEDIDLAFEEIVAYLDATDRPIFVVVDLRENSYMPMKDTFKGAISGVHQHPNLIAWLCIGENKFARYVADVLNVFSDKSKIQWFDSDAEVDAYLEEQHMSV